MEDDVKGMGRSTRRRRADSAWLRPSPALPVQPRRSLRACAMQTSAECIVGSELEPLLFKMNHDISDLDLEEEECCPHVTEDLVHNFSEGEAADLIEEFCSHCQPGAADGVGLSNCSCNVEVDHVVTRPAPMAALADADVHCVASFDDGSARLTADSISTAVSAVDDVDTLLVPSSSGSVQGDACLCDESITMTSAAASTTSTPLNLSRRQKRFLQCVVVIARRAQQAPLSDRDTRRLRKLLLISAAADGPFETHQKFVEAFAAMSTVSPRVDA